jgi:hypothetical protein
MSTAAHTLRPTPIPRSTELRDDPAAQAFVLLRIAFTVAPILFGLDKFLNVLTDDWTRYLSSEFNSLIPGSAATAMDIVGVVEIAAGVLVSWPRESAATSSPPGSAASSSTSCSSAGSATSPCATSG